MASKNDVIPGYTHPTKVVSTRGNVYKTFTSGKKKKKKELFGNTTVTGSTYVSVNTEKKIVHVCPKCSDNDVSVCPCGYSDKTCSNGHVWYVDRDGGVRISNPH
uniref:Uncharacterized protein n=1 Tax=viral metagenome TaxID=1070528 RepID=A0A6C0LUM4_9ZZZZ